MVDFLTAAVTAIAIGASAALKETASQAVKDAYGAVKKLISERSSIDLRKLEDSPDSRLQHAKLREDLEAAGFRRDEQLLVKIDQLTRAIEMTQPDAADFLLEDFEAATLLVRKLTVQDGGRAKISKTTIKGKAVFDEISIGGGRIQKKTQ